MDDKYTSRGKIGGPGHVVEIDHLEIINTQITADLQNVYKYMYYINQTNIT